MTRAARARARAFGGLTIAVFASAIVVALYAVHGSMPYNPVELPLERPSIARAVTPESWKFFTRNPREASVTPLVRETNGSWRMPSELFGTSASAPFSRWARSHGLELGIVMDSVPKGSWSECDRAPAECLDELAAEGRLHRLDNPSPSPVVCGRVGLVSQVPVPWAWARKGKKIDMPSKVVVVEVQC